jgi:hypothetical protein
VEIWNVQIFYRILKCGFLESTYDVIGEKVWIFEKKGAKKGVKYKNVDFWNSEISISYHLAFKKGAIFNPFWSIFVTFLGFESKS